MKPHTAIAAIDESLLSGPAFNPTLLVAECTSEHAAGRWTYVVAMHAQPDDDPITGEIRLTSLGVGDVVAWDWRTGTAMRLTADATIGVSLGREEWTFHVLAPVLTAGLAVIGDVSKFVTAGDARIEVSPTATGVRLVVKGAGEVVTITGWADAAPTSPDGAVAYEPATGVWTTDVEVPNRGWTTVTVDA